MICIRVLLSRIHIIFYVKGIMMNLLINTEKRDTHYFIALDGELDVYTASKFERELDPIKSEGTHDIKVDLSQLSYMDSTGLGIFVGTLKSLDKNDKELYVIGASERIERLFDITGLKDLMNITEGDEA